MDDKILYTYADLVVKMGVNLQKNQHLEIFSPTECEDFALILAEVGYKNGAKKVNITWRNENLNRLTYTYAKAEDLEIIPEYLVKSKEFLMEEKACYIVIDADDPECYKGLDEEKITRHQTALSKALRHYNDCIMSNGIRWCICAMPSNDWAKIVFPNSENAYEDLFNAIVKTMRLDTADPVDAWRKHVLTMNKHADFLNKHKFSTLYIKSDNGTDLKVGLADGHIWMPAEEMAQDGVKFVANMPTEEIFTAPHKYKVDGVLKNALPLSYNGNLIDDFTIEFKDGKIINYTAKKGYDTLKGLIETDEGTHYLGEVALIGKNSPIAKSGLLFYNTLFDENASCHLAIGKAYPTNVLGGEKLSIDELDKLGVNDSIEHVDFMIGTKDLKVIGETEDGKKITIFDDGDWVID